MKHLQFAGAALLVVVTLPATAQTERELGAHEHGSAALDVVLDGNDLYIDLDSPANNLLGFEYEPVADDQIETLANARRVLESGELFLPDEAAGCTLGEADVVLELAPVGVVDADPADTEDSMQGSDEDEADEERAESHGDIEAKYAFRCEEPGKLATIRTTLFDEFERFEDVDAQLAGPGGQTLIELSPEVTTIDLGAVR